MDFIPLSKPELEQMIESVVEATVRRCRPEYVSPFMTKKQVAAYLDKSVQQIDRYMREGMPFKKEGNEYPEFYKPHIDEWLHERFQKVQRQTNNPEGQKLESGNILRLEKGRWANNS